MVRGLLPKIFKNIRKMYKRVGEEVDQIAKKPKYELAPIAKELRTAQVILVEDAVGIVEYLNKDLQPFSAIIKHRYSDFHVHEVQSGHRIVRLTELTYTPPPVEVVEPVAVPETDLEKCQELAKIVQDEDFALQLLKMVENPEGKLATPDIPEKEARTMFHTKARLFFGKKLETSTNAHSITIFPFVKGKGDRRDQRNSGRPRETWADLGGEYCHFTLFKENRDTMDAVKTIANLLK